MSRHLRSLIATLLVACGQPPPALAETPIGATPARTAAYSITDLGRAFPISIDRGGRIAGYAAVGSGVQYAGAVYTPGSGWAAVPVCPASQFQCSCTPPATYPSYDGCD